MRDLDVCARCGTKDCIRGRRAPARRGSSAYDFVVLQRGCELALFQPLKVGNMDCTFCLDCVHACPHDNVGVLSRVPASELMVDPMRSGIGVFSRRKDIAALIMVFSFGALLNAFGMVSPVYAVENWLGGLLHVNGEAPVLAVIFVFFLIIEPLVLLGRNCGVEAAAGCCRWRCDIHTRWCRSVLACGWRIMHFISSAGFILSFR